MVGSTGGTVAGDLVVLDDGALRVAVSPLGAELHSVRRCDSPAEYLWQGDPAWWERRAPVLFPVVGRLRDDRYTFGGRSYPLGQHGFARDRRFTLLGRDGRSVRFALNDDADSRASYPFSFRLVVAHRLAGGTLRTTYAVTNPGAGTLLFSLGAHPGFRCPLVEGDTFADHVVEFERAERAGRRPVVDGLIGPAREPVLAGERVLPLRAELFARGAVVLDGLRSRRAVLRSRRSGRGVELGFPGFPYFAIWTKAGAPFVCLEPWCGLADAVDASGRLADKEGIRRLAPGATFRRTLVLRPF